MAVTIINNKLGSYAPVGYAGWIGALSQNVGSLSGRYSDEDIAIASGVANYPQNRTDFTLARISELGVIEWKKFFSIAQVDFTYATFGAAWVDSSGNLYIVGSQKASGLGGSESWLAKFNSSGVFQWRRRLYKEGTGDAAGSSVAPLFYALTTDSSDNVYIAGNGYDTTGNYVRIALCKYNTSGVLQWQRTLYYASSNAPSVQSLKVDSSGNVYILASNHIIKYNLAGTLQWQKTITSFAGTALQIDGSDNIYIAGTLSPYAALFKLDSSGAIIWQKYILKEAADYNIISTDLAIDSDGKIYAGTVRWQTTPSVEYNSGIIRFDSAGTVEFKRKLVLNPITQSHLITLLPHSRLFVIPAESGVANNLLAIPKTGVGLGTYNSEITYSEGVETVNAGSSSVANGSLTSATGVTDEGADSSLTLSDSSLTLDITAGPS